MICKNCKLGADSKSAAEGLEFDNKYDKFIARTISDLKNKAKLLHINCLDKGCLCQHR